MARLYRIPLVFEEQPEGGYTVTCPLVPELVTEGDTVAEALANVADAVQTVIELYEDTGRPLPEVLRPLASGQPFLVEAAVAVA
jgi:antitoxin HicB